MSQAAEENLEVRAQLFKALGHPTRLLILNLVKRQARHGEELAAILRLKPATISHHLALLTDVGLLRSERDQYYQVYSLVDDLMHKTLTDLVHLPQPGLTAQVQEDAYRSKVLKTFLKRGRLTRLPAQLKKQQIILEHIAQEFEPERQYSEHEVNRILLDFHQDVASLRRGLVSSRLLQRQKGQYWRTSQTAARKQQ